MVFAIGRTVAGAMAAKAEIVMGRITDGPFAGLVGEMKDGDTAALGQVHQPERLWFRQGDLALNGFNPHKCLERRVSGAWHGGRAHGPAGMAGLAGFAWGARLG